MGVFSSPLYVLRGAAFLRDHREIWKYALAPVAITTILMGASYVALYYFFLDWLNRLMPGGGWYWEVAYYLLVVLFGVLLIVAFFFLFTVIAVTIAAPFNDLISEKTEQIITGRFDETPFSILTLLSDAARGVYHALRVLGLYLSILVLGLLLLLIPVFGPFLYTALTVCLAAYMLALEFVSYPMDRKRYSYQDKRKLVRSHLWSVIGFGLGVVALASIPFLNLLLLPPAVVGGTLFFLDRQPQDSGSGAS
jgi:CysZ protein